MRCSPRLACITSLAVRRCPASLHTTPRAETGWGSSAATDADVGGCAGGLAAAGSGAVAGWCRFRKRASQRKRCCVVAERRAFPPALCCAAVSSPFYLGRLLRRGDSAVGHPPSLLWACRRESTVGSQAARAGPKGGGAARGRARQQLRLGNAAALRLARFARRALTHLRARTLAGGCSPSPLPFACADNIALGTACGKMFRCGVLSITDAGDSDILQKQPEA